MTRAELVALLRDEQYNGNEGDHDGRAYRAGWNARAESLITRLTQRGIADFDVSELKTWPGGEG